MLRTAQKAVQSLQSTAAADDEAYRQKRAQEAFAPEGAKKGHGRRLKIKKASEIPYAPPKWLIEPYFQIGRGTMIQAESGVGKTFLSNCVAKELLDSGHSVIYFTSFQLFDIFEKNTFERDSDVIIAHQNIFDCDLLIIDDLGTELTNTFTTSKLFLCLNERMLHKKSTLISTNLGMEELAAVYSERICSRIFSNYTMIKLFGDDIRLKKKLSRLQ